MILNPLQACSDPHWSEHYIGRRYRRGDADCVALAVSVQREQFGRAPLMPTAERWGAARHHPHILAHDYGEPTTTPIDGDAVAMRCGRGWHLGVYCEINGEVWVLHATSNVGAAHLSRLRDLSRQGLTVEGYYRWK
jgi:hypothetical protein